ncbi:MAG: DUF4190 domain-containing protein [Nocardioidaceae bacterium]|nr:DUF4190 domain-containing protein [Nocardioidaceae bacterium]MCL2613630.1 DUF4190 domain-containing protein [Nocardioidaceae bacterium]
MVLGILSIVIWCLGIPLGIVAIVFAVLARREIDESQGSLGGRGMAIAGLVTGIIGLAVCAIYWIVVVVVAASSGPTYY